MRTYVGMCEHFSPSKIGKFCPMRSKTKISEQCMGFREDCGYYHGTVEPSRQNCGGGYTQDEWENKLGSN